MKQIPTTLALPSSGVAVSQTELQLKYFFAQRHTSSNWEARRKLWKVFLTDTDPHDDDDDDQCDQTGPIF